MTIAPSNNLGVVGTLPVPTVSSVNQGVGPAAAAPVDPTNLASIGAAASSAASTAGKSTLTQAVWAYLLLNAINNKPGVNVPITLNNIENIEKWMVAEQPPSDWFFHNNPLDASTGTSAADGTGSYANLSTAAVETAVEINQPNYTKVVAALEANAPSSVFSAAVVQSKWASSHYGVAAAGAPAKYIVGGRGLDYIANIALPAQVSAGTTGSQANPDSSTGGANPESDLLPTTAGINGLVPGLGTLLGDLTSGTFWKRIGVFAGGAALVVVGLALFISTTKPGQEAITTAAIV